MNKTGSRVNVALLFLWHTVLVFFQFGIRCLSSAILSHCLVNFQIQMDLYVDQYCHLPFTRDRYIDVGV